MRRARRRIHTRELKFAPIRRQRRSRAGRRRNEPEEIYGPCSRGGAFPLPMQMWLSNKNGELGPLHGLWASSLLRSVREWRVTRERCKALSCLQWRAGGAAQRGRCHVHDGAPGWFETCLPIRYNETTSGSSSRSAWLARRSPRTEKGATPRTRDLDMHFLPDLWSRVRWRVLCPKGRVLHMLCSASVAVTMGSRAASQ